MKVVINTCYGGFSLSEEATKLYFKLKGLEVNRYIQTEESNKIYRKCVTPKESESWKALDVIGDHPEIISSKVVNSNIFSYSSVDRSDPILIQVVEILGSELSSRSYSSLDIVDIPDHVNWEIEEYDGCERVSEVHRKWS